MDIELSSDQKKAVDCLIKFIKSQHEKQFLLEGYAGTGKTTVIQHILNRCDFNHYDVCFSATTNKAVSVMKKMKDTYYNKKYIGTRDFKTIHKLLSLTRQIDYDGTIAWKINESLTNLLKWKETKLKKNLVDYDIVVIDEASMINQQLYSNILAYINSEKVNTKVIWVGDRAQLPPVNEDTSPLFTVMEKTLWYYLLTEVKRNHNKVIYDFQSTVRGLVKKQTRLQISPFKKQQNNVFKIIKRDEKELIENYFSIMEENKQSIILAYSNNCVNRYNSLIRAELRKRKLIADQSGPYCEGELILFNNYYKSSIIKFYTSEQARVTKVIKNTIKIEPFDDYIIDRFKDAIKPTTNLTKNEIVTSMPDEKVNDDCPICLNNKVSMKKTVCGHLFCKDCIRKWLDLQKCCPLCRMDITTDKIFIQNSKAFNEFLDEFYKMTQDVVFNVYMLEVEVNVENQLNVSSTIKHKDVIYVIDDKKKYTQFKNLISDKIRALASFVLRKLKGDKSVQKMFLTLLWEYFYTNIVDKFADITYGYCITTHKSQGSTYENCYVIMSNILTACPKYKDAIRSLYTSVTRPSESLTLYY